MKSFLSLCLMIILLPFGEGQTSVDTIQVIARMISPGEGSKIHIAEYNVMKTIRGTVSNDTIYVGYYFYNEYPNDPQPVLLTLVTYHGSTPTKDYYIFPDYNAKKGIETVAVSLIPFSYWVDRETGQQPCLPLTFMRPVHANHWYLFMPCGGTSTHVTLTASGDASPVMETSVRHDECPPVFEITSLADGKYTAYMLPCGLGGPVEFYLRSR